MSLWYHIGGDGGFNEIFYGPERKRTPIMFECTVPFLAVGARVSAEDALLPNWAGVFQEAKAEWFLPLVRRMASGESVTLEEVQRAHQEARGSPLQAVEDPRQFED